MVLFQNSPLELSLLEPSFRTLIQKSFRALFQNSLQSRSWQAAVWGRRVWGFVDVCVGVMRTS